jgi:cytidylate kinase
MSIVTIRGQLGSGAPEIGMLVAERLHIDYIDREIIAKVADILNEPKQNVIAKENPPSSLWNRISHALSFDSAPAGPFSNVERKVLSPFSGASYLPVWQIPFDDDRYLSGLKSVIKELARNRPAVIVGRGSSFILRDHPGSIHVLVVAPPETRTKRIMQSMGIDRESAEKEIARYDGSLREFIKRYFKAEMDDPVHYDIVLNTEHLSSHDSASTIIGVIPFGGAAPASLRNALSPD